MKTSKWAVALGMLAAAACHAREEIDCSQKYHQDGHEQTTAYVAQALGFGEETRRRLAFYSQAPDDLALKYSAPAVGIWGVVWIPYRQRIVDGLHSLHGGEHDAVLARRERLATLLSGMKLDRKDMHWKAGFLIHALGDSYAHVRTDEVGRLRSYSPIWGHIFDNGDHGSQPDVIARHPLRYAAYVDALCKALAPNSSQPGTCGPEFGHARACAVIQQGGKPWIHDPGRIDEKAGVPTREEAYREIEFGAVDAFLAKVKQQLDAPAGTPVSAEDL